MVETKNKFKFKLAPVFKNTLPIISVVYIVAIVLTFVIPQGEYQKQGAAYIPNTF